MAASQAQCVAPERADAAHARAALGLSDGVLRVARQRRSATQGAPSKHRPALPATFELRDIADAHTVAERARPSGDGVVRVSALTRAVVAV